jgi:membrane-associated phospholipid phosphatase
VFFLGVSAFIPPPLDPPPRRADTHLRVKIRQTWIAALGCGLFALALAADRPVSQWVHETRIDVAITGRFHWVSVLARIPGNFLTFTLPAAIGLLICSGWHRTNKPGWWKPAAMVFLGGVFVAANSLVKWIVGRARPNQGEVFAVHPFVGGIHQIGGRNQSFPSGDVCLAAATAISLWILFPRLRWAWIVIILIVAAQRILAGAHYPSDVVAAAALGWLLAAAARRVIFGPNKRQTET